MQKKGVFVVVVTAGAALEWCVILRERARKLSLSLGLLGNIKMFVIKHVLCVCVCVGACYGAKVILPIPLVAPSSLPPTLPAAGRPHSAQKHQRLAKRRASA